MLCVISFAVLASVTGPSVAQGSTEPQAAALLASIQSDKKAVVAKALALTDEQGRKFWPLYEKFQRELDVPRKQYTRAVLDYVAAEGKLTDANAKRLVEQVLAAEVAEAKLRERHFIQAQKVLPGVKAARYMQIENKIQALQRFESAKAIPLAQ